MKIMKKASLLVLLLMSHSLLHAQMVQRMFMGCTFGDKKEVVMDSLQSRGIKVISGKDAFVIDAKEKPFTYNGVEWSYVCLDFFDNQFYTITFTCDDVCKKRAKIQEDYRQMRTAFTRRFKDNLLYNLDEGLRIHDGFTGVFCHIDCVDEDGNRAQPETGTMRLFLTFTDEKIDQVKRILDE